MKNSLLVVITGISGSGKSTAMRAFEDEGFFCIDNIPIDILVKFVDMYDVASITPTRLCIGLDMRSGFQDFIDKSPGVFDLFRKTIHHFRLVFLETGTEKLLNRFKETRRRHPLSDAWPNILDAINVEKEMMSPLKALADYVIDTTEMNIHELSARMKQIVEAIDKSRDMYIEVRSFGFKKGIPIDADIVVDVRFLPNPHFVDNLRDKTGESEFEETGYMEAEE